MTFENLVKNTDSIKNRTCFANELMDFQANQTLKNELSPKRLLGENEYGQFWNMQGTNIDHNFSVEKTQSLNIQYIIVFLVFKSLSLYLGILNKKIFEFSA